MQTQFSKEFHQRHKLMTKKVDSDGLIVYFCKDSELSVLDFLRFQSRGELKLKRVSEAELLEFQTEDSKNNPPTVGEIGKKDKAEQEGESDSRVVNEINSIIHDAIKSESSDIHFEPSETHLKVRTRIDGVLMARRQLSLAAHPEIISRIKIMSGLDIAEKRRPQDGRNRFSYNGRLVDIRVSIIPADFGEKAVLRILDKEQLRLNLAALGFTVEQLEIFKNNISSTNGIILVTGPTGSGKTTTLYAALNTLKSGDVNISTVEDPIEYNLEGINQTQVKPEINLTFSAMLRALLRQDPNIIMVGEIRDRETLDIAIRASQTGHLVLSTVHTNSAVSTITRLLDLGSEPFLLSSSLKMIVAQRLLRKICQTCKTEEFNTNESEMAKKLGLTEHPSMSSGKGCDVCHQTAYRGRIAVYEVLPINDDLKEIIYARGSEKEMLRLAYANSFRSMKDRAVELIEQGLTTPSEVIRELGM